MPQQTLTHAEQAARNNARWCDAICRAHDITGAFYDTLWLTRSSTPRFYPNGVTLAQAGAAEQLAAIQDLISTTTLADLAIKDSFCALDLTPLRFQLLFEATWLWRSPTLPKPDGAEDGLHWTTVRESSELDRWEAAWNNLPDNNQSNSQPRVFLPALLADPDIRFVAAYHNQQIVGGAVANRSEDVVGISNVFAPAQALPRFWAGCVAATIEAFPGLPLVGYEHSRDLVIAQSLGFEDVGQLRVWAWKHSAS